MAIIQKRPDLRRAFYRLLGISPSDDAVTEHDSQIQETVDYFIQHGLWNAQYWLLTNTTFKYWISSNGPIVPSGTGGTSVVLQGSDSEGGQWLDFPDDFIRMAGDDNSSAFYYLSQGRRSWGQEVSERDKNRATGSRYWIENGRIYFARLAQVPRVYYDYYARHPAFETDEDPIDFPEDLRPLIAAEAAVMALAESWLPFEDAQAEERIMRNLMYWRNVSSSRARETRTSQKFREYRNPAGTGWI